MNWKRKSVEHASAKLEALEDEQYSFEDTWNETWKKRYENAMMRFIHKMAPEEEFPHKLLKGVTISVVI